MKHSINKSNLLLELVKTESGYTYGNYEIFKYENCLGQVRWCAELDGEELLADFSSVKLLACELDRR